MSRAFISGAGPIGQESGEKGAEKLNFACISLKKVALLAIMTLYGCQVVLHAIWQCQVVTGTAGGCLFRNMWREHKDPV